MIYCAECGKGYSFDWANRMGADWPKVAPCCGVSPFSFSSNPPEPLWRWIKSLRVGPGGDRCEAVYYRDGWRTDRRCELITGHEAMSFGEVPAQYHLHETFTWKEDRDAE